MDVPRYAFGTTEYFPDLLNRVRDALPSSTPADPVLLESLLMGLVSGPRHVCIRTDTEAINNIANMASSILASVFGYPAHQVGLRGRETPTAALSKLFLEVAPAQRSSRPPAPIPIIRSASGNSSSSAHVHPSARVVSYGATSSISTRFQQSSSKDYALSAHFESEDAETLASSRRPFRQQASTDMRSTKTAQSSSISVPAPTPVSTSNPPRALVVTGLEKTGLPVQRALLQVLTDGRIELDEDAYTNDDAPLGAVGVWPLPDDFILIYVCESDPRERPDIHRGLIDSFAFAAEIHIARTGSQPRRYSKPESNGHRSVSGKSTSAPIPATHASPPAGPPVMSQAELSYLRTLASAPWPFAPRATDRPPTVRIQPDLAMYATDLLSMARHFAQLDATLLTRRAHDDLSAFTRTRRVLRGDESGSALVRAAVAEVRAVVTRDTRARSVASTSRPGTVNGNYRSDAEEEDDDDDEDDEDQRREEEDEGPFGGGTVRESGDWLHVGTKSITSGDDRSSEYELDRDRADVWEASDADVRAAFPVVVRHRVRVRDGPEDELLGSMFFPVTTRERKYGVPVPTRERRTVDDILQDILEDKDVDVVPTGP